MDILTEILNRYTPRAFSEQAVERPVLDRILDAGRLAPSAKNRQPWRFISVQEKKTKVRLLEACYNEAIVSQAQAIVAVCTTNIEYRMPNSHLSWQVDLSFASAFMALQAHHEGLGCVVYTTFVENEVKEILSVPHGMRILLLLLIGHPADIKKDPADRLKRERTVSEEHW